MTATLYDVYMSSSLGFSGHPAPVPPSFYADVHQVYFSVQVNFQQFIWSDYYHADHEAHAPLLIVQVVPSLAFLTSPADVTYSILSAAGVAVPPEVLTYTLTPMMSFIFFCAAAAVAASIPILPLYVHIFARTLYSLTSYIPPLTYHPAVRVRSEYDYGGDSDNIDDETENADESLPRSEDDGVLSNSDRALNGDNGESSLNRSEYQAAMFTLVDALHTLASFPEPLNRDGDGDRDGDDFSSVDGLSGEVSAGYDNADLIRLGLSSGNNDPTALYSRSDSLSSLYDNDYSDWFTRFMSRSREIGSDSHYHHGDDDSLGFGLGLDLGLGLNHSSDEDNHGLGLDLNHDSDDDDDDYDDMSMSTAQEEVIDDQRDENIDMEVFMFGVTPATESSLEALEEVPATATATEDECSICLEALSVSLQSNGRDDLMVIDDDDVVVRMPCSHMYHKKCILKWLRTSHRCPLCRYSMPSQLVFSFLGL